MSDPLAGELPEQTRCTGPTCHALLVWTIGAQGGKLPVDPQPADQPSGKRDNRVIVRRAGSGDLVASQPDLFDQGAGGDLYRSHWASCPDAHLFRR